MLVLLGLNRKHHCFLFLNVFWLSIFVVIFGLCHEETSAATLWAHASLGRLIMWRWLSFSLLDMSGVSLDTKCSVTHSLIWRFKTFLLVANCQGPRTCFHHMKLLAHNTVLLAKCLDLIVILHHVFKLRILFFQNEQLLVKIVSSTLAFKIQNVLQVLDLLL